MYDWIFFWRFSPESQVMAGMTLWLNLRATLRGEKLVTYWPQASHSDGNGRTLGCGGFHMATPSYGWFIPSGKRLHSYGKSPFSMGKSTISMAIFNSKLLNYQRVKGKSIFKWMMWDGGPRPMTQETRIFWVCNRINSSRILISDT